MTSKQWPRSGRSLHFQSLSGGGGQKLLEWVQGNVFFSVQAINFFHKKSFAWQRKSSLFLVICKKHHCWRRRYLAYRNYEKSLYFLKKSRPTRFNYEEKVPTCPFFFFVKLSTSPTELSSQKVALHIVASKFSWCGDFFDLFHTGIHSKWPNQLYNCLSSMSMIVSTYLYGLEDLRVQNCVQFIMWRECSDQSGSLLLALRTYKG